jgi:valyl-tRNA synthetase
MVCVLVCCCVRQLVTTLMFDESYCEQGRNFANKVWNAFRLIKGFTVDETDMPTVAIINKAAIELGSKINSMNR